MSLPNSCSNSTSTRHIQAIDHRREFDESESKYENPSTTVATGSQVFQQIPHQQRDHEAEQFLNSLDIPGQDRMTEQIDKSRSLNEENQSILKILSQTLDILKKKSQGDDDGGGGDENDDKSRLRRLDENKSSLIQQLEMNLNRHKILCERDQFKFLAKTYDRNQPHHHLQHTTTTNPSQIVKDETTGHHSHSSDDNSH